MELQGLRVDQTLQQLFGWLEVVEGPVEGHGGLGEFFSVVKVAEVGMGETLVDSEAFARVENHHTV